MLNRNTSKIDNYSYAKNKVSDSQSFLNTCLINQLADYICQIAKYFLKFNLLEL